MIRNAVSHGIEAEADRLQVGKPKHGTVRLEAIHEKDNVILSVTDDGKGIDVFIIRKKIVEKKMVTAEVAESLSDQEVIRYIFEPGFSSAEKITEISGRGVGMDVVKQTVESIGGQVLVETELGKGTTIHAVLPSSLALKGALLFELDKQEYAIPLTYIESVEYFQKEELTKISNGLIVDYKGETVSVGFLKDILAANNLSKIYDGNSLMKSLDNIQDDSQVSMIIASHSGRRLGLVVDKLLRQKEIIEKKLAKPLDKSRLLSGSTILGGGNVCPVIEIGAIMDALFRTTSETT